MIPPSAAQTAYVETVDVLKRHDLYDTVNTEEMLLRILQNQLVLLRRIVIEET